MPSNKLSGRRRTPLRPHVCHSPPSAPPGAGSSSAPASTLHHPRSTKHTTPIPAQSGRCWPKPTPPPPLHLHIEFEDDETPAWGDSWSYGNPYRVWYDEEDHPDYATLLWTKTETGPDPTPITAPANGDWQECQHSGEATPPATFTTKLTAYDGTNEATAQTVLNLYEE